MISREKVCELLRERSPARMADLFATADRVRACGVGDDIHLRALIEISSFCRRDCLYCGLRISNKRLRRYRMSDREILAAAHAAADRGLRTVVLQSGEDPALTPARVARLVRRIKDSVDVAVTLSLGEYSRDDYCEMQEAGADRYLLKHETINPDIYHAMHPGMDFEHRIRCLVWLREAGFQVGSGVIVGLPGQTCETLADDIIFMRRLGSDMAGIGPLIPHPATPLAAVRPGCVAKTLAVLAVARLAMPYCHLPATTALATMDPHGVERALRAGANVIMPDATPGKYRDLYEIYPSRARLLERGPGGMEWLAARLGRSIAVDYGHSLRPASALEPFEISVYKRMLEKVTV